MCNVDRMTVAKQPLPIRPPYDKLWLQVNKVIDKLHLKNHKNPRCKELYNPESVKEKCPKLNTLVAEQTFIWASRFKKILGAMPKSHFLFFYHRMVVRRNKYTEKCYKNNMQPLLPKLRSEKSTWLIFNELYELTVTICTCAKKKYIYTDIISLLNKNLKYKICPEVYYSLMFSPFFFGYLYWVYNLFYHNCC